MAALSVACLRSSYNLCPQLRRLESRANGSDLDIGESHRGIAVIRLNIRWFAGVRRAGSTSSARVALVGVSRVNAIQPQHIGIMVIPEAYHDKR